jgi:hypothetical protein
MKATPVEPTKEGYYNREITTFSINAGPKNFN